MRVHSLSCGCFLLLCLAFAVSLCNADNDKTFEVVGFGECADCKENNFKNSQAFSGLLVSIDCEVKDGKMKRYGAGELDEEGKFKVSIPETMVENGQKLKEKCYAQLHSAAAVPCPAHNGLEASKIVFTSQINGKHTFGPVKNLKFSTALCTSKFLWPLFKYPPLSSIHSWKKHFLKSHFPPLKNFGHPWFLPPSIPKYKPPVYKPPVYKPPVEKPPVYKPPVYKPPVEKPPVYKPPVEKPPVYKPPIEKPPVYKPPVEKPPIYKRKPKHHKKKHLPVHKPPVYKPPIEKPPVYKPPVEKPPVYKPPVEKPPVYKPPVEIPPVYKPPVEKPPVYKPPVEKPPVYKPPEITKPLPPPTPLHPFPPFIKKPCPPLPKIFHHPKFGHFPPLPPFHP